MRGHVPILPGQHAANPSREKGWMTMKLVLASTDFSGRSDRAMNRAASLCGQFSAGMDILHVVDDDQPADLVAQECRQAEELLAITATALRARAGVAPTTLVRTGDAFQEIVQVAIERGADLIAMGAHRRRILRNVFVGTTIERVIRTGNCPVLMANAEPDRPYRRVVAAVDLSDASAQAVRRTEALGFFDGTEVTLLHAFDPPAKGMMVYANVDGEKIQSHVAHEAAEARHALAAFAARLHLQGPYDLELEQGQPFEAIRAAVEKYRPDLLVIGTRGLTGTRRLLLGSVADALLRELECDILAVPPQLG